MKKFILIGVLLLNTGCKGATNDSISKDAWNLPSFKSVEVRLKDGRIVQCITTGSETLVCDFEHTRIAKIEKENEPITK